MHGMDVFVLKNGNTSAPDTRKKPYMYEWSLIFYEKKKKKLWNSGRQN